MVHTLLKVPITSVLIRDQRALWKQPQK